MTWEPSHSGPRGSLSGRGGRRATRWPVSWAIGLVLLVGTASFTAALSFSLSTSETGSATRTSWSEVAHFFPGGAAPGTVPGTLPSVVSAAAGTPTVLPAASGNYMLAAGGTGGNTSLNFTINETKAQAKNTEFELHFTYEVNESGAFINGSIEVFIESQTAASAADYDYTFVYDLGTSASVQFVSQEEVVDSCPGGTCP
jgi:hypothetical protein